MKQVGQHVAAAVFALALCASAQAEPVKIGSPPHYALGLLAEKYQFDIKSVRILPLQSIPNIVAAVVGGQVDTAMAPGNTAVPVLQRGDAKLLGYAGDETPYQLDGHAAPEMIAIIAKLAGQKVEVAQRSLPYVDPEARLDVADVLRQVAWYKAQGMVKGGVGGEAMIDRRYAVALPER
jgi:NitT/TauT family transport system substrate-binding protein